MSLGFLLVFLANLDKIEKEVTQIPVRRSPVADLWDQYLLYGVQTGKRAHSEGQDETVERLSFVSMCLSEEERKANDYVVVGSEGTLERCVTSRPQEGAGEGGLSVYRRSCCRRRGVPVIGVLDVATW